MKHISKLKIQGLLAKVTFVFLCALLCNSVQAQTEIATAKSYLTANSAKEKLSVADIAEMDVSSAYLSPTTGWYHIYFNQTFQSIEVYNGLLNVAIKSGQVNYVANNFIPDLASKVSQGTPNTRITPVQALQKAATSVSLAPSNVGAITEISSTTLPDGNIKKALYLDPAISNDKIDVKLYWFPLEANDGEKTKLSKVVLTWNVRIATKDGKNIWNIHVDALSGNIVNTFDDVIHCNFGTAEHNKAPHICIDKKIPTSADSKMVVANSYNVFDYPLESPNFGARTSVLSPYTKFVPSGTGPGATNGWHNDGTTNFTNTRGNNVFAKEDLAADNEGTIGASPSSATLDFNFAYLQTTGTAVANLNAAITNLFYWNNVMHDVLWKYGFDEPGGNFQKDNLSRGGAGNDFVFADAQDGSGINNANFATPADGSNPRMQMFIFSNAGSPIYQPDSDFDNGVIAHEYGHGWSNRLTGGPAIVTCLQNAEQAGEGWSDYLALMTTTNWSTLTPTVASANIPRGIGTYVLGQLITGPGIRPFRYSYDKTNINNAVTYGGVANAGVFSLPHGIGSIWATMLWDMTWEIILQDNQIVNDIYSVPANISDYKGNVAALKLVNEGLRLQPCSPSFVQARDAILQADQMLFAGRYRCAISRAFTRRGLGALASTGISANDRVVTEDFTPISGPGLSSSTSATVCLNSPFVYTATTGASGTFAFAWTRAAITGISNPAASASSAVINETLINTTNTPITVTYFFTISPDACGGTPAQQPVNVTVNPVLVPTVATYSICQNATVPVGEGLVAPPALKNDISSTIAVGPTYKRGSGNNTTTYNASSVGSAVYFNTITFVAPSSGMTTFEITAANLTGAYVYDTYITLYQTSFNPATPAVNFLRGDDDSGTLQFSSKLSHNLVAGTTYVMVVSTYSNGVTGTFTLTSGPPVFPGGVNNWFTAPTGGVAIFTGDVFNPVGVAGSGIPNTATVGSTPFYVATGASPTCRATTTFNIINSVGGSVTSDATVCTGSNGGTLTLSGHTGTILRWESSIDNFVTPVIIANTTTTQTYTNLTQTIKYRAVVQNGSCEAANSVPATITVTNGTMAGTVNSNAMVCTGSNGGTLTLSGHTGSILRWESSIDNFVTPVIIVNTTTTQTYTNLTQTTKYRAVVQNGTCEAANSISATITVNPVPIVDAGANQTVCLGATVTLTATCGLQSVNATLSGASEVPANASTATGNATGTFNPTTNELNLTVSYNGLAVNASAGHIHNGAAGTNGPVIIPFTVPTSTAGTFNYSGVITATQATALLAGNLYINIHNATFLGGEVRGQLSAVCVANSFVWNPGALNGQTVSVSPTETTLYTLTASNTTTTCSSTATTTVNVLTPAIPVATGATIVLGGSVTLTATGCTGEGFQLNWFETIGNVPVTMPVSPIADKQYYAKCQQIVGEVVCSSAKSNDVTVVVTSNPTVTVVYVNQANVNPTQDGLTWATAYSNLQSALLAPPVGAEIWVAQGTYKPTTTLTKTISFGIPSGTMLFGGFVGTEVMQSQRNFTTNSTILSGEIGLATTIDDNSFHVVTFVGASNTTILDGFTITAGNANLVANRTRPVPSPVVVPVSNNDGGGIALDDGSSPMIVNCNLINNNGVIGGGLFATNGSNPTVVNCKFMGNEATFGGGAYHLGSNPVYRNIVFSGNKAIGGAIYNNVSNPTITNVTIAGNGGYNGAIFNASSIPVVKNSIIFGNSLPINDTQSIISYSIVEGGYAGVGNLNINPQFISLTPSGVAPTLSGDNRLTNTSAAIDAGNNGTISLTDKDLVGNLRRFNGGIVDMGAYEFQGVRVGATVISIVSGDWESNSTWDVGRSPLAGDNVIINNNHNVTILNLGVAKNVEIRTNAKIIYSTVSSKLQTGI